MTVETYSRDHLLEFKPKNVPSYFSAVAGLVYGYLKVGVDPNLTKLILQNPVIVA
ncbi:hypothetical protein ACSVDA_01365 [Cytobacillus sp. Hm23]